MAAMRPPKQTPVELQLKRQNHGLRTEIVKLRRELTTKQQYASRLEFLLHQRNEHIDQLQGQVEQLRLKNNQCMRKRSRFSTSPSAARSLLVLLSSSSLWAVL